MANPKPSQFTPEKMAERKAQREADAKWAKEQWDLIDGDKNATVIDNAPQEKK